MKTCESLNKRGYKCSGKATYCVNYKGKKINFCCRHTKYYTNMKDLDYYYSSKDGKLIVNRISRVPHDPLTNLPTRYTEGLTRAQKLKYKKEIQKSSEYYKRTGKVRGRTPVSTLKPKRSKFAEQFENKYGFKITDDDKLRKTFSDTDIDTILSKGRAAYASGSRPTVYGSSGPERWARARLASVLVGGKALAVDKDLVGPKSLKRIYS
jgi:hypothetical protein